MTAARVTFWGWIVPGELWRALIEHVEREAPREACGSILGPADGSELVELVPLHNVQDREHQRAPALCPKDGREAFLVDPGERMAMLDRATASNLTERVFYHSHVESGAELSAEDQRAVVDGEQELWPGVVQLVFSVRGGRVVEALAHRYEPSEGRFSVVALPRPEDPGDGDGLPGLPEVIHWHPTADQNDSPIPPYGLSLRSRLVEAQDFQRLWERIEGPGLTLDPKDLATVFALGLGGYSPLEGFARPAEIRAIALRGRTIAGVPWREPLVLEVPRAHLPRPLQPGALLRLLDAAGLPVGVLAVSEVTPKKERVALAGPVYVAEAAVASAPTAMAIRRRLQESRAHSVLAVLGPGGPPPGDFDARLSPDPTWAPGAWPIPSAPTPWLQGVIAQNYGATHLWLPPPLQAEWVRDEALAPELWPKV